MRHPSVVLVLGVVVAGFGGLWLSESRGAAEHRYMNVPGRTDDNPCINTVLAGDTLYSPFNDIHCPTTAARTRRRGSWVTGRRF